jgi:hypothetical protein
MTPQNHTSDPKFFQHVNALIAINNERYKTYSHAMEKTRDSTFRSLCAQNKERTVHFNMQLIKCLVQYDQAPPDPVEGKTAYHFDMAKRLAFLHPVRGFSRNACLWWDSVAQKAYRHIVGDIRHIPVEVKRILLLQQSILESDQKYSGIAL